MARILVTGAGGFIGAALCPVLAAGGHDVVAGLRRPRPVADAPMPGVEPRILGDIAPGRDWSPALRDVDVVVHLAQRAHRLASSRSHEIEPAAAAALARGGPRRLIYLSSIKAMGEASLPGRPLRAEDEPRPQDAYGLAKLASERALAAVAAERRVELVVIRPPLVYGPGVGGNFRALARLAASGAPLPFGALDNRRSLIFVGNLVDLIASAAIHPAAPGQVWLAADGADLTIAELIGVLAAGQGRRARLLPLPQSAFAALRYLPAIGSAVARLTLPLQVDDSATRAALGWAPRFEAKAAIASTALTLSAKRGR